MRIDRVRLSLTLCVLSFFAVSLWSATPKAGPKGGPPAPKALPWKSGPKTSSKAPKPKPGPVVHGPHWLPAVRPVRPVILDRPGYLPARVVYEGQTLLVPNPKTIVVGEGAEAVSAVPVFVTPGEESASEGPIVEFARLADQRARELKAYEAAGRSTREGLTKGHKGKYCKAYYRYPLGAISLNVENAEPARLLGEIRYSVAVYIQTGNSAEAALASVGKADPSVEPVAAVESYRYEKGEWEYVEE